EGLDLDAGGLRTVESLCLPHTPIEHGDPAGDLEDRAGWVLALKCAIPPRILAVVVCDSNDMAVAWPDGNDCRRFGLGFGGILCGSLCGNIDRGLHVLADLGFERSKSS